MKHYQNKIMPVLLSLLVLIIYSCNGNSENNSVSIEDTTQTISEPVSSKITELENDLGLIKASVKMKEREYFSNTGDATRSGFVLTNPDSTPEEKELAQERADSSLTAAKRSKTEMEELQKKQAEIELQISSLKGHN